MNAKIFPSAQVNIDCMQSTSMTTENPMAEYINSCVMDGLPDIRLSQMNIVL